MVVPHILLINFCDDIYKNVFQGLVNKSVFIFKATKNLSMIRKIFDQISSKNIKNGVLFRFTTKHVGRQ